MQSNFIKENQVTKPPELKSSQPGTNQGDSVETFSKLVSLVHSKILTTLPDKLQKRSIVNVKSELW